MLFLVLRERKCPILRARCFAGWPRGQGGIATSARPSVRSLLLLLRVDALHILLNVLQRQHLKRLARRHNRNLNVLCACLHNFKQRFDRQLDGILAVHVALVVSLEELADGFAGSADCIRFPVKFSVTCPSLY